jgi:hypothetical protein
MKSTLLAPIFLASVAAGAAIEARQADFTSVLSGIAGLMPSTKGVVTEAKAKLRPDASRRIIKYGPFTLPGNKESDAPKMEGGHAHGSGGSMGAAPPAAPKSGGSVDPSKPMDPNGVMMVKRLEGGICQECTVLAGRTSVVYGNGTKAELANGVYLQ